MEEDISARVQCYPRDFLKRIGSGGEEVQAEADSREDSDLELSLSLSLAGNYETKERSFFPSPSIDVLTSMFQLGHDFSALGPLAKAFSLPTDALAQKKKRKELPSRKRLDAKRKRREKRRFKPGATDAKYDSLDDELDDGQSPAVGELVNGAVSWQTAMLAMMARAQMADRLICIAPEILQVSVGSQSNLLKQGFNMPGSNSHAEVKSVSTTTLIIPEQRRNYMAATQGAASMNTKSVASDDDGSWKATECADGILKSEIKRKMMQEMPCVSTKGCGPNGTRIHGFLYKYRKGEDVRIVCVCHGKFFTPSEFVKHAGGGEVNHPLRHIVVSPTPCVFL